MHLFTFSKKNAMLLCSLLMVTMLSAQIQNTSYNANTIPINGSYSTGFGINTLHVNTGSGNTATGYSSLYSNTSGSSNTATGRAALYANTTGGGNTAHGYYALFANTTGAGNTAAGYFSLFSNGTGTNNTASGYQALYSNSSGNSNVACGYQTLYNNTTSGNIAIGYQALFTNTSGASNAAVGYQALYNNTTGNGNTANGYWALYYNSTGFANVASGPGALYRNTTGGGNVANGAQALYSNLDGGYNVASGFNALYYNTSGNNNEAYGQMALYNNTTGSNNVATGNLSLLRNTTGTYNSCFGSSADVASGSLSNATALGSGAIADASNKVRIGNTSVVSIGGQVGWTIYSDSRVKKEIQENVPGISFICLLKPVTYKYNVAKENELLGARTDKAEWFNKNDIEKITFSGFLAQSVDSAAQKIGYNFSGIDKSGAIMGLRYSDFIVPMVKAIQEQQQQIDELKKLLAAKETINTETYDLSSKNASRLEQNAPNPFSGQTIISYSIPENAVKAELVFYDSAGRLTGSHSITARGKGLLRLSAGNLSAGVYSYSLVIDGKIIDSKKLTRL